MGDLDKLDKDKSKLMLACEMAVLSALCLKATIMATIDLTNSDGQKAAAKADAHRDQGRLQPSVYRGA